MDPLGLQKASAAIQAAALAAESRTAKDAGALLVAATGALNELVGGALADLTAERTELVNDIHGLLDRLNGAKIVIIEGGFALQIPERKSNA